MVYQGKPSRGCQMCRTRRIKCDETKPTCKQCAKSRRQCPGYKDEFDLVFRNETQATERRAQRASRKALQQKMTKEVVASSSDSLSPTSSLSSISSMSSSSSISTLTSLASRRPLWLSMHSLSKQPQLNVDDRAACHFISNYVLVPKQGTTRGFLEYVLPLLKVEEVAPHFKAAFEACATASFANHSHPAPDLEKLAVYKYTKALSATYRALQNPVTFRQDATLASILLLGLFENITAKQLGMLAWGSHIEGAIQLVKSRGRKQLRTKTGVALFIAVRTQMIIHTLSTAKPPLMDLKWWVNEDSVRDQHASQCQKFNIQTGEIRAEVNRLLNELPRNLESIQVMQDLIRKAQAVDLECVKWAQSLPDSFQCRTVAWEDSVPQGDYAKAEVFPGRVDAFQDLWVASVWNMMRCSRMILASIVVRCAAWVCSPVDYRTTPEYSAATRICVENITDIIASVPYQLGWFIKRKHLLQHTSASTFGCGEEDSLKSLSGYFLTWPLACIYGQDYTTDSQRAWIKGRLNHIGTQLGVRYALMLGELHVRIPSMLIRRDGLVTNQSTNFEKLLSTRSANPLGDSPTHPAGPLEHAMQSEMVERQKAELVNKVMGNSGVIDEWTAKTWLQMQHISAQSPSHDDDHVGSGEIGGLINPM